MQMKVKCAQNQANMNKFKKNYLKKILQIKKDILSYV